MNILLVVDMQRDFVNGSLGSSEAMAIVEGVCGKIKDFSGEIFVTMDTHGEDYLLTPEGKKLPVKHCIIGSEGWQLNSSVKAALEERKEKLGKDYREVRKETFGALSLPDMIKEKAGEPKQIEILGLCTDICVISNALILKNAFPSAEISVHSALCAGVTPEKHAAALEVMASCQINIV